MKSTNNHYLRFIIVYLGGLLTGLSLILYPAMGIIFTDSSRFAFTNNQFGRIFIFQTLFAIIFALITPILASKYGIKKTLISGVIMLMLSTFLLYASHFFTFEKTIALNIIFLGASFLGIGFGLVITILNPLAYQLFPNNEIASVSGLHFSLGIGTAGAPLLLSLLQQNPNSWKYLPLITSIVLTALTILILLDSYNKSTTFNIENMFKIPKKMWGFILIVTLYGICEGTLGSFGSVFLKSQGLSIKNASLGLAMFWSGLALGRIIYSLVSVKLNVTWFYIIAALFVAIILFSIPYYKGAFLNISLMAFAGIFMACIFPSTVSWATKEFTKNAVMVSGFLVAALQLGTGISTNLLGYFSQTYSISFLIQIIGVVAFLVFLFIFILKKPTLKFLNFTTNN